ncbi:MAG TPA: hypothetical protein VI488_07095 [Candidatus Angelobacter sp.]
MDVRDLGSIGQFLSGIGIFFLLITAWVAYKNYSYHTQLERLKWLSQLFESFYSSDRYRAVRQQIDFDDIEGLLSLLRRSDSEPAELRSEERAQVDLFTDYLNFFEWIAFLESKEQLAFEDVDAMFNYYLKRLLQVDHERQLRRYIREKGFERLHRLLNRYSLFPDA